MFLIKKTTRRCEDARVSVAEVVSDDRAFAQDGIGEKRRDAASVSIITRGREQDGEWNSDGAVIG